jgi:hypothetical protein
VLNTTNYGLRKPEGTDNVNIDDLNYNAGGVSMFEFLKLQWQLGKITEARLQTAVDKGYLTEEEMNEIIAAQ